MKRISSRCRVRSHDQLVRRDASCPICVRNTTDTRRFTEFGYKPIRTASISRSPRWLGSAIELTPISFGTTVTSCSGKATVDLSITTPTLCGNCTATFPTGIPSSINSAPVCALISTDAHLKLKRSSQGRVRRSALLSIGARFRLTGCAARPRPRSAALESGGDVGPMTNRRQTARKPSNPASPLVPAPSGPVGRRGA